MSGDSRRLTCLRAPCLSSSAAGFEGCSMVPSIYPLETLHNSLSLKQVNEFLTGVCESAGDPHTRTTRGQNTNHDFPLSMSQPLSLNLTRGRCLIPAALSAMFAAHNQPSVDSYIPQRVLSSSISLRSRSDRPPWCEYGSISSISPECDIFRLASLGCLLISSVCQLFFNEPSEPTLWYF